MTVGDTLPFHGQIWHSNMSECVPTWSTENTQSTPVNATLLQFKWKCGYLNMSSGRFLNLPLVCTIVEIIDYIQQTHKLLQKLESGGGGDWVTESIFWFLSAFAKLWKVIITFIVSVCPSAWNDLALTGWIFMKFYIWVFFESLSRKFQVSLKADKNNWYFIWRPIYIFDHILLSFILRMRNVSDKNGRENQNTYRVFNNLKIVLFVR